MKLKTKKYLNNFIILILVIALIGIVTYLILHINDFKTEESYYVDYVQDGDSFVLKNGEEVRLICVNTPEYGEKGFEEARGYLESLILHKRLTLVKDVSETDNYGRFLRYVYVGDVFVNKKIVDEGYAEMIEVYPDTKLCGEIGG